MAENFFPWVSKLGAPGKVLANAIAKTCGFNNDTNYPVTVILHDGNVELNPGESMENWIVTGFSVYLVMHFPKWEPRIEFPSTEFNNMEHNLSAIFADKIKKFEDDKAVAAINTDNKPRLSDLAHLGIINACSPVWRQLGGLLGLDTGKMDNFTKQALFDNVQCCERVFDHWINNDGFPPNYPLSWMTVYDVLCAIDRRKIADEMKEKLINKE